MHGYGDGGEALAGRAVPVAARVMERMLAPAVVTAVHVAAEHGGSARLDGGHDLEPAGVDAPFPALAERGAGAAEDLRHARAHGQHGGLAVQDREAREGVVQGLEHLAGGAGVRQRTIRALGRKDALHASGELDRLIASLARHSERAMVLSDMEAGRLACTRIGGPLLFGRLWERLGLGAVVNELVEGRGFEFALERAVFVSVLHRLFVSGSDRSCEKWMGDYAIPGIDGLRLHHLYRAMSWLGEEAEPAAEGDLAPRCVKDAIEEGLFERRRDLFTEMSLVFMDTTTLSFHGAGGGTLGAHGHSKDHRPDLRQMVVAAVLDGEGRPVCTEMLPGNTADTTVLLPIVDRLRSRFGIGRVCVVADRGMISAATIKALEERGLDYILGARERGTAAVREVVLRDSKPFVPLLIERGRGDTQLFVKEVAVDGARYIVCRNEAEAEKDRADRQAVVDGLRYLHPPGRKRPVPSAMNPVMQVEQSLFQPVAVFMPRHPVHACRSVLLQREVGHAERVRRDVVQKSSELLLRFPRGCLPYPLRRL